MRRYVLGLVLMLCGLPVWAAPLGTATRSVIPGQIQQIITVDYRALRDSQTALALKDKVLPDNLKQFESSLKQFGINLDTEVEELVFAAFRSKDNKGVQMVGVAQGQFPTKKILLRMKTKKIRPEKYRDAAIYPMSASMTMSFIDASTMLFGEPASVKAALDARDGYADSLNSNSQVNDMIASVESGAVWSVLDDIGTQNMMRSALGDASRLADYDTVKKKLLGSRYTMDFNSGVNFDLDVLTADSMTASTMSALIKAGVMFRKMSASPVEKIALDSVTVDSDSSLLKMHFKTDDKRFQALLDSDLFAAVSR